MSVTFKVNGVRHTLDIEMEMPLLWVLRNELGLTGTKFGCGVAACGACTVHVDGEAMRSCLTPVSAVENSEVVTIEGLAAEQGAAKDALAPIQAAWIAHQVPQCGYCQSGMLMAVSALLKENPKPTDADIDEAITNVCRCGTYPRIRAAIHSLSNA
ncbi:MAG: (2Fe-2S)-binding protein [Parvibaculum sp.]|uniref:(2Fe-2S)-binding protein n=1 Tax=Parvibaculum sp. TaxID=2024848 RepID=UPI0025D7C76B|nr:(2Fe-2S)-binding protein [Parvibaculum sp.]MCE9650040.1 (2Fe-2S)-binding protein [Parvibaculum sp.]